MRQFRLKDGGRSGGQRATEEFTAKAPQASTPPPPPGGQESFTQFYKVNKKSLPQATIPLPLQVRIRVLQQIRYIINTKLANSQGSLKMHKYSDEICKIVKSKKFLKQPFPLLQVIYQSRFAKKIKIC